MHQLTAIIQNDMKPALGVTEPGDIAFVMAKAKSYTKGEVCSAALYLSSGIYKNAFTCGIPKTNEFGNLFSAALGITGADHTKGLMSLEGINQSHIDDAHTLIKEGKVKVFMEKITSCIYLRGVVRTATDTCEVVVEGHHTNISKITCNDRIIFEKSSPQEDSNNAHHQDISATSHIFHYTFQDFYRYITHVDVEEISFLKDAYEMNLTLFEEGLASDKTTITKQLFAMNQNQRISQNEVSTAQLLSNGALEARVLGLNKPAMSITGSGAHGIICTMPLYALAKVRQLPQEVLLRATAFSYLTTIYIKEYSGVLSAFCGCAIAAGTGMAVALCYMMGGTLSQTEHVINNMAASITGMICDGGNAGCTMKGITAVDIAFRSVNLSLKGAYIDSIHGIIGKTPEDTMRNMGLIASPGMLETEKVIVDILKSKSETSENLAH